MSYPQDNPYGQPDQNPYGQGPQDQGGYGQSAPNPYGQPQPGGPYDSAGGPAPFGQATPIPYGQQPPNPYGQPAPNPYGQPGNPYDGSGGQIPGQPYGQQQPFNPYGQTAQNPYGQPGNQYDASGNPMPTQPQFYGGQMPTAKSNNGMIAGIVSVAVVVALGVGGYFLFDGKKSDGPSGPVANSVQSGQPSGGPSATASGSPAAQPAQSGSAFSPPTDYSSNSLEEDDGCSDFAGGEANFLSDSDDLTTTSSADNALTALAAETKVAAGDSENSTLASALDAEAAYITQNEAALAAGMVSYNGPDDDETQITNAFQGIADTDTYINGVCGLDSWSPTEP